MNALSPARHFSESSDLHAIEHGPLTRLHALIAVLCAFGFAIDLMEITLGNALSVIFSAAPYRLHGAALSWLLSSVYIGAILGAPTVGWVADRIGPKRSLGLTLLWLAVTSSAAGISPTPSLLTVSRLCSGLALGAYPPLMIAYLTDIAPIRRRGRLIFMVCAIGYLAPPAALMAVRWLGPVGPWGIEGWRWPYYVGGFCCLAGWAGFIMLPEAPHWLTSTGRSASAVTNRFLRFADGQIPNERSKFEQTIPDPTPAADSGRWRDIPRSRWGLAATIYFLTPWLTVAFPLVAGPILLARHVSLSDTLYYVAAATFGPVLGTCASALLADRLTFRTIMIACAALMTGAILVFFASHNLNLSAGAMILMALGSAAFLPSMTTFGSDLFAAQLRGKATTSLWVANRMGAILSPLAFLPLVERHLFGAALGLFCVIGLGLLFVLVFVSPRVVANEAAGR
ncbi:MFS transporter [Novosphingobium terrae]|uniref:MFS transporter n=1 Tax=Novosphingobium terrae TaxID=2726189 RepID=UPI0019807D83|nr:MFS transporter [Novosphingobium terrae]